MDNLKIEANSRNKKMIETIRSCLTKTREDPGTTA